MIGRPESSTEMSSSIENAILSIGSRRELFVDHCLIDSMRGVDLRLQTPVDCGEAINFDRPWEGQASFYSTVLHDNKIFRAYYRGRPEILTDETRAECTCVAESGDGIHWEKPELGLVEADGTIGTNIILCEPYLSTNFCPMLDANPAAAASQRYKALAGGDYLAGGDDFGVMALVSEDGLHWKKLQEAPVFHRDNLPPEMASVCVFDSQNVVFWSEIEQRYLAYFRVWVAGFRRIARMESLDFRNWSRIELMEYRAADGGPGAFEELYVNQTFPYFRAPHLYVALAGRFVGNRKVLSDEQIAALGLLPSQGNDISDAVFLTSRGGAVYDRVFPEAFVRPGIGLNNWGARSNFPALNVIQTGPAEMSFYLQCNYSQPTAHLRRYSLRLDGFSSLHAPWAGGEMVTKPLIFDGDRLSLNMSTSAAGSIRVELQDLHGRPYPGFELENCEVIIGNEIDRSVRWKRWQSLAPLSGRPVRFRFAMNDADIFSLQITPG